VDPARALSLARAARDAEAAPAELMARADALAQACAPAADPAREADAAPPAGAGPGSEESSRAIELPQALSERAAALDANAPIRLVHCRLLGASDAGLDLATEHGKRALLPPGRVAALAGAVVTEHTVAGRALKNAVLLDLLLHPRPGDSHRTVLRLPGHDMALAIIHPGVAPPEAYARVVEQLLVASGAQAAPSPEAAAGRPFARFGDAAAFEAATWGRSLVA